MKRCDKIQFVVMSFCIGINCLISACSQDLTETVAWCLVLLSHFRMRSDDEYIDRLHEIVAGKIEEVRDAD